MAVLIALAVVIVHACSSATSCSNTAMALGTILNLIDLFEERPCLFDTKHKDYFIRDLRSKALEQVSKEIGFPGNVVM